jgi:hypothetical protein
MVIMGATICYTIYAALQWETLDRQLTDLEAVQRAHLVVEQIKVDTSAVDTPAPGN